MQNENFVKYLYYDERRNSSLTVTAVGHQHLRPDLPYPKENHPEKYLFSFSDGRVLDEYQILYLANGEGSFFSGSPDSRKRRKISEGTFLMLFPGEWHCYFPSKGCEWNEYWIGFKGPDAHLLAALSGATPEHPFLKVGSKDGIVDLYREAYLLAATEGKDCEKAIEGIIAHLAGLAAYYSLFFKSSDQSLTFEKITQAKMSIAERLSSITPEELAADASMSYSNFRKLFKQDTGLSPGQFILQRRIAKAKGLLRNTSMSIKEIAIETGFDNLNYFSSLFKEKTGFTPSEFRARQLPAV